MQIFKSFNELRKYVNNAGEFSLIVSLFDYVKSGTLCLEYRGKPIDANKIAFLLNIPLTTIQRNFRCLKEKGLILPITDSNGEEIMYLYNKSVYYLFINDDLYCKRDSQEIRKWRKAVLDRDHEMCCCCGSKFNLEAHHISNYAADKENRVELKNGITLCQCCHSPMILDSFHQIYGTRNNTKDQLQEYFDNKRKKLGLKLIKIDDIILSN